ncbi:hypothetical protein [Halomonas korlensis]|uniref:Uncharacterized protein n=1 Tax=Halomonas korlensis TaxID=463301 RepID=A0A1I7G4Q6_9GAMM|nr:hypothetical protein [Halomonas korlensis]SFU43450.1 hypothetical protein SAMN04487955_102250 [Halomonas korlensis]
MRDEVSLLNDTKREGQEEARQEIASRICDILYVMAKGSDTAAIEADVKAKQGRGRLPPLAGVSRLSNH